MIDFYKEISFVKLKDDNWLANQRIAATIASQTIELLSDLVLNKTELSLLELNNKAEEFIIKNNGVPTFKGYKGFPAGVCISVNEQLVHGIPSSYSLKQGDIVSFDLGVTYNQAIADTAVTWIYGESVNNNHIKLIDSCRDSLYAGIKSIAVGKRLGVIGNAVFKTAKNFNMNVITDYGGHGLDNDKPHAPPFVANRSSPDDGIRIQKGLTVAIEPMLTLGDSSTKILDDGWTVVTASIGAHFEHSVFVHENCVEILTHNKFDKIEKFIYFK